MQWSFCIHTAGKKSLSVLLYGAECCGAAHPGNPHMWGKPRVPSTKHQPSLNFRPIKGNFISSCLVVFCKTTPRVELRVEARPIPCTSLLEEAWSPFVTCVRVPACRKLWTGLKIYSEGKKLSHLRAFLTEQGGQWARVFSLPARRSKWE